MTESQCLNVERTSERLEPGHGYTRRQLRDEFSVPRSVVITASFLPSGFSSIWIFLAEQDAANGLEIPCSIAETSVQLRTTLAADTARLLAQHQARGLELLAFLRKRLDSARPVYEYLGTHTFSSEGGLSLVPTALKVGVVEGQGRGQEPHSMEVESGGERGAMVPLGIYQMLTPECAITGSKVDFVLVATPIEPTLPAKLEDGLNVLMLRTDIAELFKRNLVAIDPGSMTVRVGSALGRSEYALLSAATVSGNSQSAPSRIALAAHLAKFMDT
ncbi:hypothetical protein [Arthrobacter sp. U41]|uniref:hypothetical protein n=1 Tax=Arthrobacter sp. U41 TaxID=1849032 RepID=UPI0011AA7EBD|nr:hypothetical protein [Arthrobacter sp. U41]